MADCEQPYSLCLSYYFLQWMPLKFTTFCDGTAEIINHIEPCGIQCVYASTKSSTNEMKNVCKLIELKCVCYKYILVSTKQYTMSIFKLVSPHIG